jgi:putative aldouronate transport system substrate-binding protein
MKVDDFRARWKQGKYGMFVEDFCALACQANYKAFDASNPKGNLQLIDPPKGPSGKSSLGAFTAAGNNWLISKKAMDAGKGPAIAKFLEWANSGEGYYLLGFGQKDVNYKLDSNNNIVTTGIDPKLAYNSKESQPILQLKGVAYNGNDQELTARYAPFKTTDGRSIEPLNIYKATFNSPYVDGTPGQLIHPAANSADISRYTSENLVQFALGQKPVNEANWKTFIDGLNGIGFTDYETAAKKTLQAAGFK